VQIRRRPFRSGLDYFISQTRTRDARRKRTGIEPAKRHEDKRDHTASSEIAPPTEAGTPRTIVDPEAACDSRVRFGDAGHDDPSLVSHDEALNLLTSFIAAEESPMRRSVRTIADEVVRAFERGDAAGAEAAASALLELARRLRPQRPATG
jgi:hypothetical protein